MMMFWIVAALLVVAALGIIMPSLLKKPQAAAGHAAEPNVALYRDQLADLDRDLQSGVLAADQFDQARQDLERRLAEELEQAEAAVNRRGHAGVSGAVIVGVPLLAIALYSLLGNPQAFNPAAATTAAGSESAHAVTAEQIEGMIAKLAQRLKAEPGDAAGWSMLGRSYAALNRFPEASSAFSQAVKLLPDDAQLLADYADTLAMAQGRRLAGEPRRIIARALAADPNHFKALALAGSAAFEAKDYAEAVRYWEHLVRTLPPNSELAKSVAGSIAEARGLAGGTTPNIAKAPSAVTAGAEIAIRGAVRLSPALAAQVAAGDTVFVFARAISGPKAPLAVRRFRVDQLPAEFVLDESAAMAPNLTLAQFKEVVVGARISKSGSPTRQRGDLEGLLQPVRVGSKNLELVIDTVLQ